MSYTGVLLIILSIALTMLAIVHFSYRRYIRRLCRHLAFIKKNQTNLNLRSELPYPELERLVGLIGEVMSQTKKMRIDLQKNADRLREDISNLSHDIRTPLTSLDGYVQLLAEVKTEEERERIYDIIRRRIRSLGDILEELFDYARFGDEDYKLKFEEIDIAKTVLESVIVFYDAFNARGLTPTIEYDETPFMAMSNQQAVHRLVQNIVKNALDHGKKDVKITLKKEEAGFIFECANDVEHPEEIDLEQVFSRFYKADSARSRTSGGLGLAISKSLAELLGASISAALEQDAEQNSNPARFRIRVFFPKNK